MAALIKIALTLLAQLLKLLAGLILVKVIAFHLGPAGLGLLGHFLSLVSITTMLAGGGIANGIIKYVAEFRKSPGGLFRFVESAAAYSFVFTAITLAFGIALSKQISLLVFKSGELYWIIILLSTCQWAVSFTNIVVGVATGLRYTNTHSLITIIGISIGLPASLLLVRSYGIPGAAVAVLTMSVTQCIPAYYYYKRSVFYGRIFKHKPKISHYRILIGYTGMLATSVVAFPVVEILIREKLILSSGYSNAGTWQASIRLSSAYLSFFGVFLAYYFVPSVSAEQDKRVISRLLFKNLSILVSIYAIFSVLFYAFRNTLIPLLLSADFNNLRGYIVYQLIGDFFKISAQAIGYISVAKAATKIYIGAEILQSTLFFGVINILFYYTSSLDAVFFGAMISSICYFTIAAVSFGFWIKK